MADTHEREVEVYNEPVASTAARREPVVVTKEDRDLFRGGVMPAAIKRVSWGAILAGSVVALVTQIMLSLLGLAAGLATVDPATEANPFGGLAVGTGIWLAISTIISLLIGGYVAARLAGLPRRQDGIWHGIVTWGFVSLLALYLMTSAVGQLFNTATGIVGRGLTLLGDVAPVLEERIPQDPNLPSQGEIQQQLPEVSPQQAQQIADQAAASLSSAALWAFIAMAVGLAAAAAGGAMGSPRDMPASPAVRRE